VLIDRTLDEVRARLTGLKRPTMDVVAFNEIKQLWGYTSEMKRMAVWGGRFSRPKVASS
jgi:hypothetical protein